MLLVAVFVAELISNHSHVLLFYFPKRQQLALEEFFTKLPALGDGGEIMAAAGAAFALGWLSCHLKRIWQIGVLFGLAEAVSGGLGQ